MGQRSTFAPADPHPVEAAPAAAPAGQGGLAYIRALDGLRGVAVAAVVAFHLGVAVGDTPLVPGGYLGVDVFFCLSGFLITRLLVEERASSDRISLRGFWFRRARRLLPALFATVAAVVVVVALDAATADIVGPQRDPALATLLYVANWHEILGSTAYFEQFVTAPLGHTWSLAIEEQFYVVWPLVAAWALRRSPRRLAILAGVGAVASSVWFVVAASRWGLDRAYYGTDTRLAAILAGAALGASPALFASERRGGRSGTTRTGGVSWGGALGGAGVVAAAGLVVAFATARGSSQFLTHGGSALVAVLSCVLVLVAAGGHGPVARVLQTPPLVTLGRLSYSVYLWHIPVIAVLSPQRTGWVGWRLTLVRLVVTGVASAASYRLLERPIRHSTAPPRRLVPALGLATGACAIAAVLVVPSTRPVLSAAGADGYDPDPAALPRVETTVTTPAPTTTVSVVPPTEAPVVPPTEAPVVPPTVEVQPLRPARRLLVVGDSVAWSLESQLRRASTGRIAVTNRGTIGCNIWKGEAVMLQGRRAEDHPACQEWPARWSSLLSSVRPEVAMLVLGTSGGDRLIEGAVSGECDGPFRTAFRGHVTEAIDVLSAQGAMVVVTTVAPRSSDPDPEAPRRAGCLNDELRAAVADRADRAELIDLAAMVCPGDACRIEHEGSLVRPDGLHFGSRGTPWVGRWLLDEVLEPGRLARHGLQP